ncbi:MAG: hypothetical protein IT441_08680 [Phycisphaeraceae bacterium]|nr:hypothetical protein [Phycisphaeraceae bacterium]
MASTPLQPRKRPLLRLLLRVGAVMVVLLLAGVGTLAWLWFTPPAYWTTEQTRRTTRTPEQARQRAADLKKNIAALFRGGAGRPTGDDTHHARLTSLAGNVSDEELAELWESLPVDEDGNRCVEVPVDDLNDWLETYGPQELQSQGVSMPSWASEPMVTIEGGKAVVAMQINHESYHQVVSAVIDVRLESENRVYLRMTQVRGGQVPVKGKSAADAAQQALDQVPPERRKQLEELAHGQTYDLSDVMRKMGAPEGTRLTRLDLSSNGMTMGVKSQGVGLGGG